MESLAGRFCISDTDGVAMLQKCGADSATLPTSFLVHEGNTSGLSIFASLVSWTQVLVLKAVLSIRITLAEGTAQCTVVHW